MSRVIPEDKHTIAIIATLHPKLRTSARAAYDEVRAAGIRIRYTSGLRTFAEQQALYDQGRTKPGQRVTNARPGTSWHNYGFALDFVILSEDGKKLIWDLKYDGPDEDKESDWMKVVAIFKKHSWKWGGDWATFKDYPHFEYTFGLNTKQALAMYNAGKRTGLYLTV